MDRVDWSWIIQRRYWPRLGSALIQWIGLEENHRKPWFFPQNGGGACNFSLKQIHWFISLGPPSMLCPIYIPWPSLNHGIWRFYASILGLIFRSSPAWIMWKVWCFKASCRPQLDSPFPVPATPCRQYLEPPFLTLYRQNLFLSKHFDGIYNDWDRFGRLGLIMCPPTNINIYIYSLIYSSIYLCIYSFVCLYIYIELSLKNRGVGVARGTCIPERTSRADDMVQLIHHHSPNAEDSVRFSAFNISVYHSLSFIHHLGGFNSCFFLGRFGPTGWAPQL